MNIIWHVTLKGSLVWDKALKEARGNGMLDVEGMKEAFGAP